MGIDPRLYWCPHTRGFLGERAIRGMVVDPRLHWCPHTRGFLGERAIRGMVVGMAPNFNPTAILGGTAVATDAS